MYQMSQSYSISNLVSPPPPSYSISSPLETIAYSSAATPQTSFQPIYQPQSLQAYSFSSSTPEYLSLPKPSAYHFQPDTFIKPGTTSKFVGHASEIQEFIEDAFHKIFDQPLPNNIKISVLNKQEFQKIAPHPGTLGLSINRQHLGLWNEVFVLNDSLARTMLTMGHELGHVLSPTLPNKIAEEAKAYAFSLIWMEVIKEHNIAGLGASLILENPAANGLHDVAFAYLAKKIQEGYSLWDIYTKLIAQEFDPQQL